MFEFNPENSMSHDTTNKKVINKTEDETTQVSIVEFVGLKSNMYSYIKRYVEGGKKTKGINKDVVKTLNNKEYINKVFEKKRIKHEMKKKYKVSFIRSGRVTLIKFKL